MGGLLSLFLAMAVYVYLKRGFLSSRRILLFFGIGVIVALVIFLRFSAPQMHILPAYSVGKRFGYLSQTWEMIRQHPLLGAGPGNFNISLSRYAHNSYLQIWAETGILGIISFLWLVGVTLKKFLAKISLGNNVGICLLTASCAFLIHNLIDFTFFLPEVSLIWWVILGLL